MKVQVSLGIYAIHYLIIIEASYIRLTNRIMDQLFTLEAVTSLLALTFMEILLGIDNVIFVSIILGRLPGAKEKNFIDMDGCGDHLPDSLIIFIGEADR